MTVYIDDMFKYAIGRYRRMRMSHMIADNEEELHAMAQKIGVDRKWYQGDHYDVCMKMRDAALQRGAINVTMKQLAAMLYVFKLTKKMPKPYEAQQKMMELNKWLKKKKLLES